MAISSQCIEIIHEFLEIDDDIVSLCRAFMEMNLKCLSTQISQFVPARGTFKFVKNVFETMLASKSNPYDYCNNLHVWACEPLDKICNMNEVLDTREVNTQEADQPDSIQDLSDFFFKNVTLV